MESFDLSTVTEQSFTKTIVMQLPDITGAVVVLLVALIVYVVSSRGLKAALLRTPMQQSLVEITVGTVYKTLVFGVAGIFALQQLGFNVTAALAGVGVLGLAAGFAAQQTLANVISGFGIFIDHLYKLGDWVTIDDHYGEVVSITLRTTKIRTLDNTFVSIPNSMVTDNPVVNYSEQGMVRVTARVAISYTDSIHTARTVLIRAAREIEGIELNKDPEVVVGELGDSGVNLLLRVWIKDAREEQKYQFRLTEVCKEALDQADITIPFPQRDVHLIKS